MRHSGLRRINVSFKDLTHPLFSDSLLVLLIHMSIVLRVRVLPKVDIDMLSRVALANHLIEVAQYDWVG